LSQELLSKCGDYWEELDRFYFQTNPEDYPQRDYIIRMTETCNLDCPICLAKANTEETVDLDLEGLESLINSRRRLKIDLMAAEPTLREDLELWIRRVKEAGHIAALHTNGLKLANLAYAKRIKAAGVDEVFLQFDGFDEQANKMLRGRPLLKARMAALDNLRSLNIATSLIVVVARNLNEQEVAKTFSFALAKENTHIREVFFLGLRVLGSLRAGLTQEEESPFQGMTVMPDEIISLLCNQVPGIERQQILQFNKLYFALLSVFKVKKCLYVQHYLVLRDEKGGHRPISEIVNLEKVARAADRYARSFQDHPVLARTLFLATLARCFANPRGVAAARDLLRLQGLFQRGMNLDEVPRRLLLLGFITACDPHNFDASVAINCGKGELSTDGGFIESGAVANVEREARFEQTGLAPGNRGIAAKGATPD
jgi:pyruvate-formate lyase-activating enzyme